MRSLFDNNTIEAFRILLKKLNVRFTSATISLIKDHPEFPSLMSFSHALSSLELDNMAIRTTYEQMQHELPKPCVVHLFANGGMYLVVDSVENNCVNFINENGAAEALPKDEFLQTWSQVALILEKRENAEEPGFQANRMKDVIKEYRYTFGISVAIFLMTYSVFYFQSPSPFSYLFFATKTIGLVVSIFLMIQFFDKNNPFIKRVCGASNSKANCSGVLDSPAAYIFGIFSWSEIGLLYFSTFFLFTLFANSPGYILLTSYFSIAAAPYTAYSIYYQWRIAKSWCKLCLLIQVVLFFEFILSLIYLVNVGNSSITKQNIFLLSIVALVLTSIYSILKPIIVQWQSYRTQFPNLRRIKFDREVFSQLSLRSRIVDTSGVSPISFGNKEGNNRITVITNPTCVPCKALNKELFSLLKSKKMLAVDEIFLAEQNPTDPSYKLAEFMLRLHSSLDADARDKAFGEYYLAKNATADLWREKYSNEQTRSLDMNEQVKAHHKWCIEKGFYSTPVVLLNQRFLPDGYSVYDLKYLLD